MANNDPIYGKLYDIGGALYNVKHPDIGLKGDGTTETSTAISALQTLMSAGKAVFYWPEGTYVLPTGTSLTLHDSQTHVFAGRERTIITCQDAYAFITSSSGNTDRVQFRGGVSIKLRSGSTSGGAIRAGNSSGYASSWILTEIYGDGQTSVSDPVFDFLGWTGSRAEDIQAQQAQVGIKLRTGGIPTNAATIRDFRVALCTQKGVWMTGGAQLRLEDGIVETNSGKGVVIEDSPSCTIQNCWFENQGSAHVEIKGAANRARILDCSFYYHQSGSTQPHVLLTGPTSPAALYGVRIVNNVFVEASGSGKDVEISATVAGTQLLLNQHPGGGGSLLVDNGTGTRIWMDSEQDNYNAYPQRPGGIVEAAYDPYYNTQQPTLRLRRRASQTTSLLQALDESNNALAAVANNGAIDASVKGVRQPVNAGPASDTLISGYTYDGYVWFDSTNTQMDVRLGGSWLRHSLLASLGANAAASTLGTLVKKVQVFDKDGVSLGYVPVYSSIT
jgi:hypothetical protein